MFNPSECWRTAQSPQCGTLKEEEFNQRVYNTYLEMRLNQEFIHEDLGDVCPG